MGNEIKKYCEHCKFYSVLGCQSTLICTDGNRFLTTDVQKVKHGKWELTNNPSFRKCSECGAWWGAEFTDNIFINYCPKCGAKMDGDETIKE